MYSEQRNTVQQGYAHRFDIYALCQKDRIVVSYGDRTGNRLDAMKSQIRDAMPAEEVRRILEKIFQRNTYDNMKYVFKNMPDIPSDAKALALRTTGNMRTFGENATRGVRIRNG